MVIREMSREECLKVLARARLARLACAHDGQPYVVPVYLAYQGPPDGEAALYGFTTLGQKVEWMRANPLVCVEVDEVAAYDQWVSIIVFGHYEEFPETPGCDDEQTRASQRPRNVAEVLPIGEAMPDTTGGNDKRFRAWQVLKTHPMWQEPGSTAWAARAHRDSAEPFIIVYYKIWIDRVTGHEATRDARDAMSYAAPAPPAGRWGWLVRALTHAWGAMSKSPAKTKDTADARPLGDPHEMVPISAAEDPLHAQFTQQALLEEGIHCEVRGDNTNTGAGAGDASGFSAKVLVEAAELSRAEAILRERRGCPEEVVWPHEKP